MSTPTPPPTPIRLRIGYKSPESLLAAFTQGVGQGKVELPSKREVALGTKFLFELLAKGLPEPVCVLGEVTEVVAAPEGGYRICVRYQPPEDRAGLDAALRSLFAAQQNDRVRSHPRVPFHMAAHERGPGAASYVVKDLSQGGARLEVERRVLPENVQVGTPAFLQVVTSDGTVGIHGAVAWVQRPDEEAKKAVFGLSWGKLRRPIQLAVERLLILHGLPVGPWSASVSFGMDAVAQMP